LKPVPDNFQFDAQVWQRPTSAFVLTGGV
jgi:hypothetical protein